MAEFMKLRLRRYPVRAIRFGARTELAAEVLTVDRDELARLVLADPRLASVSVDVAVPGESCRIVHVQDVIQPRAKIEGPGTVFPGFLGSGRTAGSGTTHCLDGMAVVSCGEIADKASSEGPNSLTGPRNRIIDMSGPVAMVSPFSQTLNLVLTYRPAAGMSPQEFEAAMRLGSLRVAERVARASEGRQPAEEETLELTPALGLPRVVYITQLQNDGFLRDTYLYGEVAGAATVPTVLHPNELADGVLVNASISFAAVSTHAFQDNQVVRSLYRRHGKEVDFAGVVVTTRHHLTDAHKGQRAWFAAKLAKQLGAQGAVLSQEGGGNSIVDQMLCCQACEALGIQTTVLTYEMGGSDGTDFPLIYHVPEARAIASTGNREVRVHLPPMERALGGERYLFANTPAVGPYTTHVADIAFAIDLSGFWRLRTWAY
ncbi:MAG: beta-aspartyl-peptidase [Chloroflexi bacterium]|nr:beta-aspartyl-peptidase [Chloroflexota bacterium]